MGTNDCTKKEFICGAIIAFVIIACIVCMICGMLDLIFKDCEVDSGILILMKAIFSMVGLSFVLCGLFGGEMDECR